MADFYVHGFCIFAGNIRWLEGTTEFSFGLSMLLAFIFFLLGGMFWISSAVNARKEEKVFEQI